MKKTGRFKLGSRGTHLLTRLGSFLLALCLLAGMMPVTAQAAITHTNDWAVFTNAESAPETTLNMVSKMISNEKNYSKWQALFTQILLADADNVKTNNGVLTAPTDSQYAESKLTYATSIYDAVVNASATYTSDLSSLTDSKTHENEYKAMLETLPTDITDVLYAVNKMSGGSEGNYHYELYSIQLFYDFEVEPLAEKFTSAEAAAGDTQADLTNKGITYSLNSTGDNSSSSVVVSNLTQEATTVSKGFEYTQSERISTETSHTYTDHLGGSTSLAVKVGFKIPFIGDTSMTVTQTADYSRDITDTYTSAVYNETIMTSSDTIELTLPAHTSNEIHVSNYDATTGIPYTGATTIRYKTMLIYFGAEAHRSGGDWDLRSRIKPVVITFGNADKGYSAIEDLDDRIANARTGYDPDGLDTLMIKDTTNEVNVAFHAAAADLLSGQPYAPYSGFLKYAVKTTSITPGEIKPLYAAQTFLADTEQITLYTDQTVSTKNITIEAENAYGVAYYGFSQRLHGSWAIVNADGSPNTAYATLQTDVNGYAQIVPVKATNGASVYLTYVPEVTQFVSLSNSYTSEKILLEIKSYPVSTLKIEGDFGIHVLGENGNATDVSDIKVYSKTQGSNSWDNITESESIEWYAEEPDGITVTTDGKISFTKIGTYQIYAVVDEVESNRLTLEVLPPRTLAKLQISGEIGTLYWNGTPSSYDLSKLTITGTDNYGDPYTVDPKDIVWSSSNSTAATVSGNTLNALANGMGTVTAQVGDVFSDNYIAFEVKEAPYPAEIIVAGSVPALLYNEPTARSYDLTKLSVSALDQYSMPYSLDINDCQWVLSPGSYAEVSQSHVITGKVVGTEVLTLTYKVDSDQTIYSNELTVQVKAAPVLSQVYYNGDAIIVYEGDTLDLTEIILLTKDQYGEAIDPPDADTITWSLQNGNGIDSAITLNNEKKTFYVQPGTVPEASSVDVTLTAAVSNEVGAANIILKVRQKPYLKTLSLEVKEGIDLKLNNNYLFSESFTLIGYDQYGDMMDVTPFWYSTDNEVVAADNTDGTLTVKQLDQEVFVYCTAEGVESNRVSLALVSTPYPASIQVKGAPASMQVNTTLDISTLNITVYDQHGDTYTQEDLTAYPAFLRFTVIQNGTTAEVSSSTLKAGDTEGEAVLVCAVVNADTNSMAETQLRITITAAGQNNPGNTSSNTSGGTPSSSYYTVSFDSRGGSTVAQQSVSSGKTAVRPDDPTRSGYLFTGWFTDEACTTAYDFNAAVTEKLVLYAGWESSEIRSGWNPFVDVSENDWFHDDVKYVWERSIMGGTAATIFSPELDVTRGTVATVLWRMAGEPVASKPCSFTDLTQDWYKDAVNWAAEYGVVLGYNEYNYGPEDDITREQLSAMLWRYAKWSGLDVSAVGSLSGYSDTDEISDYAKEAMLWANVEGLITGRTITTLDPKGVCTRAELAAVLHRFMEMLNYQ